MHLVVAKGIWLFAKGAAMSDLHRNHSKQGKNIPHRALELSSSSVPKGVREENNILTVPGRERGKEYEVYSPPFVSANTPVVLFIHRSARDFHEKKSVVSFCQNLSNIGFCVASFSYIVNDNTPLIQQIEDIYSCINSVCERLSDTQADKHRVHLIGEGAETIPCLYSAAIQKNPVLVDAEYSVMCNMEISSMVLINGLFDLRLLLGRYKNLTRLRKELIKSILGLNRKPINTDGSLQLSKCLLISIKENGRKHKSRTLAAIFKRNNIPHIQKEYQLKPQIKPYFPFVIPDSKEGHQVIAEIAAFITEFEEKY